MKTVTTIVFLLICFISTGANAADSFSINGYYKNFFVAYDMSDAFESIWTQDKPIGMVSNRIRLDATINIGNGSSFNLSYSLTPKVQDNSLSLIQNSNQFTEQTNYRVDDFDSRLYPDKNKTAQSFVVFHNLDRAYFSINLNSVDIYLGRQAIAWGSARSINPTDVIAPYNFDELDSEERIGVDAIRLRVPIGFMGEFDAGYLFGNSFDFDKSAFYLRGKFYAARTDFSLLALGFKENLLIGFDMTRAIGGAGFWLETAYVISDAFAENANADDKNYFRSTIGFDYSLSDRTYGFIEYHFNQPGESKTENYPLVPSGTAYTEGSVYFMGQHYLIPGISYQISPLIVFNGETIWNITDNSLLLVTSIEYNIAENIYLSGGSYIGIGKGIKWASEIFPTTLEYGSEFGAYADSYYTSFRVYF